MAVESHLALCPGLWSCARPLCHQLGVIPAGRPGPRVELVKTNPELLVENSPRAWVRPSPTPVIGSEMLPSPANIQVESLEPVNSTL